MDDGDLHIALQTVRKIVGCVAGDGNGGTAAGLQQLCIFQKALVQFLRLTGKDGGSTVWNFSIRQNDRGQMLLIPGRVGVVQHELVKHLGGLGSHTAQYSKFLFGHMDPPYLEGF